MLRKILWFSPLAVAVVGIVTVVALVVANSGRPQATPLPSLPTPVLASARVDAVRSHLGARVGLDRRIDPVAAAAGFGQGCVYVAMPNGSVLFDKNASQSFIPASTTKLVTAATALDLLGPDARFTTEALIDGSTLYLRGKGDPTLATPGWIQANPNALATPLAKLADQVKASGKPFTKIVIDATWFNDGVRVDGWEPRYSEDGTAPSLSALAVDRSKVILPKGAQQPVAPGDHPDVVAAVAFAALVGQPQLTIESGKTPDRATSVAQLQSPTVAQIIADMNKRSDNFIAEMMARQNGRATGTGTTAAGVAAVRTTLTKLGVDPSLVTVNDGSGLHRANRISCAGFGALLDSIGRTPKLAQPFYDSLAVGGTDGTLKKRDFDPRVHAKTGTLADVSTLAGYTDVNGQRFTFVVMENDVKSVDTAHNLQENVVAGVNQWPNP